MLTPPAPARCQRRARLYVAITLCTPCNASPRTGASDARPLRHMPSYMPSQTHAKSRRPECIRQAKMARTRPAKRRARSHQGNSWCVCARGRARTHGTTWNNMLYSWAPSSACSMCSSVSPGECVHAYSESPSLSVSIYLGLSVSLSLFLTCCMQVCRHACLHKYKYMYIYPYT